MAGEIAEFQRRLSEAIEWCASRASVADPGHSLRTPALRPAGFGEPEVWLDDAMARVQHARERSEAFPEQVQELAQSRAMLLRQPNCPPVALPTGMADGRLFACYPDASVSDGFSGEKSGGFLDADDRPPWDTWVCYIWEQESRQNRSYDGYLISWVPPAMIEFAQRGIEVNPMDCVAWAEDLDEPFIERLRAVGLLG